MNRRFTKPIRTYGKKKCKDVTITASKLRVQTLNNIDIKNSVSLKERLSETQGKEADNSMYYDPFDTTFDRLVRNARVPPQRPETYSNEVSYNSTDNSSNCNISKSEKLNYRSSLCEHTELADVYDIKSISIQRTVCKKLKMQITKRTIKKKPMVSQNNEKFMTYVIKQIKKSDSYKKPKVRKTRNNNKRAIKNLNLDSMNLSFESNVSVIKDYRNNHSKSQKKNFNRNCFLRKEKQNNDRSNTKSIKNVPMKTCSVVLNTSSVIKWSNINTIKKSFQEDIYETIPKSQQSLEHEIAKINIKNEKHNNLNVKHCFVKVERLNLASYMKPCNFKKRYENLISSTPNNRPVKSLTALISLSPISIGCSEKLNNHMTNRNNISASITNKDIVSIESMKANTHLCRQSDILEKYMSEKKCDLLSTCLTNTSNYSKCNLNPSENSLTKINCISNNICNQEEYPTKRISEKFVDLVQNVSKEDVKKNDISNKSILTQKYIVSNTQRRKHHLNFSIDENGSHSLFNDTNESIQTQSHNGNIADNVIKMSTNNLILDKTKKILHDEVYSTSIKLSEKSISNANNIKLKVTCDKMEEEPSELLISAKSMILDTLSSDAEFKLKAMEVDDNSSNVAIITKQTESLSSKNNVLNINNSFVNSNKKYSVFDCYVNLKQLQDSTRITKRRKQYCKWDLDITSIPEDCNNDSNSKEEKADKSTKTMSLRKKLLPLEHIIEEPVNNTSIKIEKPIYLKPGKFWARSLSILNNIQNESNLDKLSIGKGKKWRHSVQDILNMQKQGIIESCIKKKSNDEQLQVCNETINKSEYELANNKSRTCDSTNLGRLSRRISVRVVPIHETVKSIEDASFLEVYGIVPVKSQRFTLINNPVCTIQNDNTTGQIIGQHSTAKEVILQRCLQEDYIPFCTYFSDLYLEHCRKIGEGVYGEVFLYEHEDKKSVIKIIPIEGNEYVNGEPQKKFHEILSEIVIAMELYNLRFNKKYNTDGFVEVKNIKCIKGKYPEKLVELWNIYDEEKRSDNDCPSMFNDDQLYIVLELGHGGQDLEAFVFHTADEAYILFIQAALALAVAEKAVEFEHRDLHWGNILISPTNESYVHYKLGQKKIKLISKGVKVSIIDFTLSRVTYQGCSVFNDLALDPTLFTAQGEYQFEIYRLMRDKVKNDWQKFEPYTNVLWLHYTLDKMITAVRYKKRNLKIHKNGITKLKELKNEILSYSSAFDFVTNSDKIVDLLHSNS